jgi:hypothetical protein
MAGERDALAHSELEIAIGNVGVCSGSDVVRMKPFEAVELVVNQRPDRHRETGRTASGRWPGTTLV